MIRAVCGWRSLQRPVEVRPMVRGEEVNPLAWGAGSHSTCQSGYAGLAWGSVVTPSGDTTAIPHGKPAEFRSMRDLELAAETEQASASRCRQSECGAVKVTTARWPNQPRGASPGSSPLVATRIHHHSPDTSGGRRRNCSAPRSGPTESRHSPSTPNWKPPASPGRRRQNSEQTTCSPAHW